MCREGKYETRADKASSALVRDPPEGRCSASVDVGVRRTRVPSKQAPAAHECLVHLQQLAGALRRWFYEQGETDAVLDSISGLNRFFLAFESLTQPNFTARLEQSRAPCAASSRASR